MYNLLEYSKNYVKTSATLLNYYKDISIDPINSVTNSEFYRKNTNNGNTKKIDFFFPLKHLSNFWRTLDMPLINCEVNLILTWSKNYVLTDMTARVAQGNNPVIAARTGATFTITDFLITIISYVPVVTLSTQDDNKLLEQLTRGFKRTIKGNKYRSVMSNL